uniref:Uncharacterized protein n=1 Tax=Anguilla anguilla TaxID=7936 RepID=A0A0E9S4U6_ANGAN
MLVSDWKHLQVHLAAQRHYSCLE